MNQLPYFSTPILPWDRGAEDEKRFRLMIIGFLILFVVLTIIISSIDVPEKQREQVEKVPPRLAKLIMEKRKPPPPPPPPKEEKKEEPKVDKKKKEEKPKPEKKKEPPKKTAKEKAKAAIAVFDDLADLRDQDQLKALDTQQQTKSLGTAPKTERALISRLAAQGSGGVSVSKASSGGGGSGTLAGVTTSKIESSLGDAAAQVKKRQGGQSRRTTEDIQIVFDRHKGGIYSLYRRALRKNPVLEGTLVLRLVIEPSGKVSRCEVVSSELNDPSLERKIVLKVKKINFGARDVEVWKGNYPLNFIPS